MSGSQQKDIRIKLNTIDEALEDIRNGRIVIVVDDEDRENEGDFICAAELVTPETINFMATYGKGLICASLTEDRCQELDLPLMVSSNTSSHSTAFTVSVDLLGHGCTTGISGWSWWTLRPIPTTWAGPDISFPFSPSGREC